MLAPSVPSMASDANAMTDFDGRAIWAVCVYDGKLRSEPRMRANGVLSGTGQSGYWLGGCIICRNC